MILSRQFTSTSIDLPYPKISLTLLSSERLTGLFPPRCGVQLLHQLALALAELGRRLHFHFDEQVAAAATVRTARLGSSA